MKLSGNGEDAMTNRLLLKFGFAGLLAVLILAVTIPPAVQAQPPSQASYNCQTQTSIPADQCEALVALYQGTGGTSWTNRSGWLSDSNPCAWHGVSCFEGKVVALDLFANNLTGELPLDIGGFPELKTLTLNDNPLSGPIPVTITFLDLDLFHFHGTRLCEPPDPTFQDWLSQIVYRLSSGISCLDLTPTAAPTATLAPGQSPAPTSQVLWPHQTLTALAAVPTVTSGPSLTPTPTKYYTVPTRTPTATVAPIATIGPAPTDDLQGNALSRLISGIPPFYFLLLLIPLGLIIIGVVLEIRERRLRDVYFDEPKVKNQMVQLDYYDPNEDK